MELKLQIPDKTAKKIKALAILKGIDADYIGDMISNHIDALITAEMAIELGLESDTSFNKIANEAAPNDDVHDRDDDMSLVPDADHGLSAEGDEVVDNTPVPESFVEQTPPPMMTKQADSFSSLVDQNISNANVTDDPEEYMDDMMNFDTTSAKEAAMPVSVSVPLSGGGRVREASGSFGGRPRVNISEVQHGTA